MYSVSRFFAKLHLHSKYLLYMVGGAVRFSAAAHFSSVVYSVSRFFAKFHLHSKYLLYMIGGAARFSAAAHFKFCCIQFN